MNGVRFAYPLILLGLLASVTLADQDISLPDKVTGDVGAFIRVTATTKGDQVVYVPLTPGLNVFPAELLKDSKTTVVSANAAGTYKLLAYSAVGGKPTEPAYTYVVVGAVSPNPTPGPTPGPTPNPGPINVPVKAWLVVVEETSAAAKNRGAYFTNAALWDYMGGKGWVARIVDKDVVDANGKVPADLKFYIERARGKSLPLMYLVDQDGVVRVEGPLPSTPADLLQVLKKVGG